MIAPCMDCNERYFTCHSRCEKYIDYKQIIKQEQEQRQQAQKGRYISKKIKRMRGEK